MNGSLLFRIMSQERLHNTVFIMAREVKAVDLIARVAKASIVIQPPTVVAYNDWGADNSASVFAHIDKR